MRLAARVIGEDLPVLFVAAEVFEEFLDVLLADLLQDREGKVAKRRIPQRAVFISEKLKKDPQIVGVGQTRPRPGRPLDPPEILAAEARQPVQDLPHFLRAADILCAGVFLCPNFLMFFDSHVSYLYNMMKTASQADANAELARAFADI